MRRFWIGLAGGFTLGYTALRAHEALADLRAPEGAAPKDARAYGRTRRALMLVGMARSTAALGWTAFALARSPQNGRGADGRLRRLGWVSALMIGGSLLDLPVDYVEDHVMERRYGLSKQSAPAWLAERAKALGIGVAIGLPLIELLVAVTRRAPRNWPLVATLAAAPLLVLANLVAPTFIMPLFNAFEPVTGDLERQLRALARRYGVGDAQILRVDMSRQTEKANAYVTGLFGAHRIVIGDTLLGSFPNDEIEFVVAHELGHYVHRDVWIGVAIGTAAVGVVLFGARSLAVGRRGESLATVDALARFLFFAHAIGIVVGPVLASVSRSREWAADRFAVEATSAPKSGVSAFQRLRDRNLAEDEQPRWMEVLFSSHPSLRARIDALEAVP